MRSVSSAPCDGSAWTTSWSSTKLPCGIFSKHTSSTTNIHGHIWRWRKTRQIREQFNLEKLVWWLSYHKWAGCIIAMSEEPPESAMGSRPHYVYKLKTRVSVVG